MGQWSFFIMQNHRFDDIASFGSYGVQDATWEVDLPSGKEHYVKVFEHAARREGFDVNHLGARIILREAREFGLRI